MTPQDFIMMPIPAKAYTAVCALLGGALVVAGNQQSQGNATNGTESDVASPDTGQSSGNTGGSQENVVSAGTGETAPTNASPSDGNVEIDAHGHPWSADMHAATKGKTKDGLWRMKVGVKRPDPAPGYPLDL